MRPEQRKKGAPAAARAALLAAAAWSVIIACAANTSKGRDCEKIRLEFRRVLEAATYTCTHDGECVTYPALVNCGGVVDSAAAEKMAPLLREYDGMGCPKTIACAPRLAEIPACVRGRCAGRSLRHGR